MFIEILLVLSILAAPLYLPADRATIHTTSHPTDRRPYNGIQAQQSAPRL